MSPISLSLRSRIVSILLATILFMVMVGLQAIVAQRSFLYGIVDGALIGCGVGLFEEFYVQSVKGRWLRSMHPLQSMLCYVAFVMWLSIAGVVFTHFIFGRMAELMRVYARLPVLVPLFLAISFIGVSLIRIAHFTGTDVLFDLLLGTYFTPRLESKVLLFLDMNGSTALSTELGVFDTASLVGRFIFDVSKPITDNGGGIYLYKGDGLIALWDWKTAIRDNAVLRAVDAIHAAVERDMPEFRRQFGIVPSFRIGVHGGEVVVREQGDIRRGIGIFGEVINVASRMEEAARTHNVGCVMSEDIARMFDPTLRRFHALGEESIKGLPAPIRICEYRPSMAASGVERSDLAVARLPQVN